MKPSIAFQDRLGTLAILCIQGHRSDVAATLLNLQGLLRDPDHVLVHLDEAAVTEELEHVRAGWQAEIAPRFHVN